MSYFNDPETGKTYALDSRIENFLEKFEGFCPTCKQAYLSRWKIAAPEYKEFIGTKCKSYWNSLNKRIPEEIREKYCGHEEHKGWIHPHDVFN